MAPVRYTKHCAGCHPNTFHPEAGPAPHDRPEVIHAYLRGLFSEYIVSHPEERTDPRRFRLGREPSVSVTSQADWVNEQVSEAEKLLFRDPKRCAECHFMDWPADAAFPTVEPTRMPVRWLPQSVFDHGMHRLLACGECHPAATSTETKQILLPGVKNCQGCHRPEGAPIRCSECHTYHPATGPREMNGRQKIQQLAAGEPAS